MSDIYIYHKTFLCIESYAYIGTRFTKGKVYNFYHFHNSTWKGEDDFGDPVHISVCVKEIWGDVFTELPLELENK